MSSAARARLLALVINFLQETEHLSFSQALDALERFSGGKNEKDEKDEKNEKNHGREAA